MIPNFFKPFAALETFSWSCLYDIFWLSLGSSPTHIIAVLSFLSSKCRSIQLAEAFKVPSWNHLILTSLELYLTSLILLYGFIQVILFPSFLQNSSLFLIDFKYLSLYLVFVARLFFTHCGFVFIISSFEFSLVISLIIFFLMAWNNFIFKLYSC